MSVPVIAIDGPTASGKGTVAAGVSAALGFHLLDSGSLYRLVALRAIETGTRHDDGEALGTLARSLDAQFRDGIRLGGRDVSTAIRAEAVGGIASRVAAVPAVRAALVDRQRAFRRPPGLVADGRDMGTVIFPDAALKVYLTASLEARAERRHKQLIEKGFSATLVGLLADLRERDSRDMNRADAPLRPAEDARPLDTSRLTVEEAVARVLGWWEQATVHVRPR